ncbi:putative ribonuclease H-like domain-containing protein [Tanacetum coccineum]
MSMNYQPVFAGNQTNGNAGTKANIDAGQAGMNTVPGPQYVLLPFLTSDSQGPKSSEDEFVNDAGKKTNVEPANEGERNGQEKEGGASNKEDDQNVQDFRAELDNLLVQQKEVYANSTNRLNIEETRKSKKDQRTLLKQQYENFSGSSSETMDQTFDRLQKLISQLEIQGEVITQEDMNLKLLKSLPSEWKTHALIWRNKEEIETISLDDFTNSNCNNSTNKADNTSYGVSAAHTQCNSTSGDNLNDAIISAFLASQPNSPQLVREDLEQIDPDDLEEMDLQWEMAMLTIRARRFTRGQAGKYRAPRNQENRGRENNRRIVTVETPTENALVAQDGIGGYDWSYQAEEEHPINFALMAHTSSGSSSSSDSKFKTGLGYNATSSTIASLAVESFVNSFEMLENQENNKSKSDKGYHVVPPPFTGNFIPFKPDLTFMDEIVESENMDVIHYSIVTSLSNVEPKTVRKNSFGPPVIEDWNSDDDSEVARHAWNNSRRVNHKNFSNKMTHPHPKRSFVPQAVLTRSGKLSTASAVVNIVRSVNTANTKAVNTARPVNTTASKQTVNHPRPLNNTFKRGYSQSSRPFNRYFANKNSITKSNVNTVSVKHTTARDRAVVRNKDKRANVVKASACWDNPQQKEYKEKSVIDSGCSMHMTENKGYLDEYEDYDGGLVSFGDGKGRISGKDTECLVLSSDFKLLDESQVLLKVPKKDNIYSVDLKSVVPTGDLTCLIAKATIDESNTWHRRFGHINFKTMNKLVKGNLVKGLPSKIFENDHSCVACQKGKQHKASYKTKLVNSINKPLHMLHMDLFGPTHVKSLIKKSYCLVVTDDFSIYSWGIKREFSMARTLQQNGVAEKKNRTLIEAARTMLVDSKFPTTFWAEAVNTDCYVLNRVLVIKPHNKIPYELIHGRPPLIDFMKPFGCPVTILNTWDYLGKFDAKAEEGYFVGYSMVSKAMRVFNQRTRIVEETLNIRFLKNTPNVKGNRPDWLFDVDTLTISMNYVPVVAGNKTNGIAGTKDNIVAGQAQKEKEPKQEYILIPLCTTDPLISQGPKDSEGDTIVDGLRFIQQALKKQQTASFNTRIESRVMVWNGLENAILVLLVDYYCQRRVNTARFMFNAAVGSRVTFLLLGIIYREMITSQLQGKLWLYDEVLTTSRRLKNRHYGLVSDSNRLMVLGKIAVCDVIEFSTHGSVVVYTAHVLDLLSLMWHGTKEIYLKGSFVSFREMITSQLQGKLWLYDEVFTTSRRLKNRHYGLVSDSNRLMVLGKIAVCDVIEFSTHGSVVVYTAHVLDLLLVVHGSYGFMGGPSTPGDPMSDKPSNGLDTSVYVTVESFESDMTLSENQK